MDGATLSRELEQLLGETASSSYLDSKSTYDYLYEAALRTVQRTNCLTSSQEITTTEDGVNYYLNADFLKLYLSDDRGRQFIKYNDGTNNFFIYPSSYDSIVLANNDDSQSVPDSFCIRDAAAITRDSGTATSTGAATGGVCTLTDTAATFTTSKISAGDFIHNTTDGSQGVVISITSETALVAALFGGTDNDWTSADAYYINPQKRFYLTIDPLSSTAAHTITVYYVQKPAPVYSSYYSYQIPINLKSALVQYAAWLYKYRDGNANYGDAWFKYWDLNVRQYGREMNLARQTKEYRVILKK